MKENKKTSFVAARITEQMEEKIHMFCKAQEISKSMLFIKAIEAYVKRKKNR